MNQVGTHILVDAWGCKKSKLLDDPKELRKILRQAVIAGKATVINITVHQFSPHGVTAVATLAESHLAIHTWPEYKYYAADLFFCGDSDYLKAVEFLRKKLPAKFFTVRKLKRGLGVGVKKPVKK